MNEQTPDLPDTASSGATPEEKPDLRDLLTQVAAGAVDPSEAARRLDAGQSVDEGARSGDPAGTPGDGPHVRVIPGSAPGPRPASGDEQPIDRIVVRATANKVILLGDASVTGAAVEGSHVARRDGGTLVIDTDAEPSEGDFAFETTTSRFTRRIGRWRGPETVIVKVRPDLPVEASVMAGSLVVDGLRAGMRFSVDAGSLKARDCSGPVDGRVASGSATLDWRLDSGASRLRCELGSIKVQLDPRSDVTVRARADLGSVDLGPSQVSGLNAQRELVVGGGSATLDMDVSLGSIKLAVG